LRNSGLGYAVCCIGFRCHIRGTWTQYNIQHDLNQQSHNTANNTERNQPLTPGYLLQCWTPYAATYNLHSWRWEYRCPKHVEIFMIINHNCCIKLVPLVIFIYEARSHIHQIQWCSLICSIFRATIRCIKHIKKPINALGFDGCNFMAQKSPPFRRPHEWLKQFGDHYAIKLHPKNQSAFAGLLIYSRASFCDGSFYDDLLLRPLSSRTEHSRLVVHHCRNSRALSLLNALSRVNVFIFSILVHFFKVDWDFSIHDVHQKDRKEEKIKTVDITFFLDVFWTTAWAFFSKIKSDLIDIFFNNLCDFLYT